SGYADPGDQVGIFLAAIFFEQVGELRLELIQPLGVLGRVVGCHAELVSQPRVCGCDLTRIEGLEALGEDAEALLLRLVAHVDYVRSAVDAVSAALTVGDGLACPGAGWFVESKSQLHNHSFLRKRSGVEV